MIIILIQCLVDLYKTAWTFSVTTLHSPTLHLIYATMIKKKIDLFYNRSVIVLYK